MSIVLAGVKLALGVASNFGAGVMTGTVASMLIPEAASTATKVCCYVGAGGIAMSAGKAASNAYSEMIDSFAAIPQTKKLIAEQAKVIEEQELDKVIEQKKKELQELEELIKKNEK